MTTEHHIDPKVVSRIHKLLALSQDGGATEAEATLAAERVQEIMRNHNISMAMLDSAGGSDSDSGYARTADRTQMRAMYKWQRELMAMVGHVNFCHIDIIHGYKTRRNGTVSSKPSPRGYRIIGREANVVAARELFDYLIASISRILMEQELHGDNSKTNSRQANSFRMGASERLQEKLRRRHNEALAVQKAEAEAKTSAGGNTSNALVVVLEDYAGDETDLNRDFRLGWEPGTTAKNRKDAEARAIAQAKKYKARLAAFKEANPTIPDDVAALLVRGICDTLEEAEIYLGRMNKPETEKQRQRREARAEREWERYQRKQDRAEARIDQSAYQRGSDAAEDIGLDKQVEGKGTTKIS